MLCANSRAQNTYMRYPQRWYQEELSQNHFSLCTFIGPPELLDQLCWSVCDEVSPIMYVPGIIRGLSSVARFTVGMATCSSRPPL